MITIPSNTPGTKYVPYWRTCVGAGRANEGLRAAFQRQLQLIQDHIGFGYLRFHGLFHDDMFVMRQEGNGEYRFNFQYIDELFDSMLEKNIRPFVELGFFPDCIRGGDATQFWWKAHVTPPENYDAWCLLVERFVRHLLSRYGVEEVHKWYFEVWNEPNLSGFWDGTKSQYFELYKVTARTIKSIDPALRVGGPATSNFVPDDRFDGEKEDESNPLTHVVEDLDSLSWHGVWIEDFLRYCAANSLPVDFVSTHPYPTDFALDTNGIVSGRSRGVDALLADLTWLRNVVSASAYPHAEIHLTEWSSSPTSRDCTHDYLQEAAFIVKTNLDAIGLADSLSYWTFTDVFEEVGAGDSIFHGGFGLINYQGIVKPGFHAYRMLSELGDEYLYRDMNSFVTRGDGGLSGIFHHYPIKETVCISRYPDRSGAEADLAKGEPLSLALSLSGLEPGRIFTFEKLSRTSGWALPRWFEMGCPEPPTREQTEELRLLSMKTESFTLTSDEDGVLHIDLTLDPWEVVSFREGETL